jgi:RNA 2',3'-cyclic 3'-phosphodiesterase
VRLFVAIVPPPAALAELSDQVAPLRLAWPGLRWTGRQSWHVTLAFLGETGDEVLPGLGVRLERAARRHRALPIAVRDGGAFPRPRRATVVWAGLAADGADGAALAALAASVAAGTRRAGAPSPDEGRQYRPHLTLARLREPADVSPLVAELAGLAGQPWTARHISLVRSHLPDGPGQPPRYEELASWPLGAPDRAGTPGAGTGTPAAGTGAPAAGPGS